mmetsp:Transcript_280/g.824  ORF Transcript_280/g.824 Transcript_280/m.824 type:complete len:262 (-) Transcript_280:30-815(-)
MGRGNERGRIEKVACAHHTRRIRLLHMGSYLLLAGCWSHIHVPERWLQSRIPRKGTRRQGCVLGASRLALARSLANCILQGKLPHILLPHRVRVCLWSVLSRAAARGARRSRRVQRTHVRGHQHPNFYQLVVAACCDVRAAPYHAQERWYERGKALHRGCGTRGDGSSSRRRRRSRIERSRVGAHGRLGTRCHCIEQQRRAASCFHRVCRGCLNDRRIRCLFRGSSENANALADRWEAVRAKSHFRMKLASNVFNGHQCKI